MSNKAKILIFTADSNGGYPVPAVKGGAVSTLIEHLVESNEKKQLIDLTIVSLYEKSAREKAESEYPHIKFIWIKPSKIVKALDKFAYLFITKFFKNKKSISFLSLCSLMDYIIKASYYLKRNDVDKVIIENNVPMSWIIKFSKYKGDYYFHFHNVPRINAKCKEVFENATGYLCVSDYVAQQIQSADNPIGPIKPDKTMVLYNCIDTSLFRPIKDLEQLNEERRKFGFNSDEKIVVFVGRLSAEKGIDKVLQAVSLIENKELKVLIVGSLIHGQKVQDAYQQKLLTISKILGDRICFTGYIDQKELSLIYNIADVAVLPSIWDEPAGLTMVEAMACGTPVITTKSGGIPEYMGKYGIVLDRGENLTESIAEKICYILYEDKTKVNQVSKSGVEHVRHKFSADIYLQKFVDCLEMPFGCEK